VFAVRDEEAALDIVQDAMLRLSQSYGDARPRNCAAVPAHPAERDPRLVPAPEGALDVDHAAVEPRAGRGEEDDQDPLETLQEAGDANREDRPPEQLERAK
jgi:RNA polymerase sigma-70 factor (ECF subfamily)